MSECAGQLDCLGNSMGVATSVYLFCFITTVIGITTLKYKNYGFTIKLLVVLVLGAACQIVFYSMNLSWSLKFN